MVTLNRASGQKIADAIDKRIRTVTQDLYSNAPYNVIRKGRVTAIKNKFYTVKINNAIYTKIYALKNVGTINVHDVVLCVIPNNQYSEMFILGVLDTE